MIRPVLGAFFKVSMHKFTKAYGHMNTISRVGVEIGEADRRVWVSHVFGSQLGVVGGAISPCLVLTPSKLDREENLCVSLSYNPNEWINTSEVNQ